MKNEGNVTKIGFHWTVPVLTISIVALLGILISYMILKNFTDYYISGHPIIKCKTIIFIGLLIILALGVSTVRLIKNTTIKSLLYLILGFTTFWIVGAAYHSSFIQLSLIEPKETSYLELFSTDISLIILAMANAITVLVALIDGRKNGIIFGSMGFTVIIFPIAFVGFKYVNSMFDILLLLIVLWALIPTSWIKILAETVNNTAISFEKRIFKVLLSAILTLPIYIIIGLLTYNMLIGNYAKSETFSLAIFVSKIKADISLFAFSTGYLYILTNVILVGSIFTIYNFALYAFNVKKEIETDGTIVYIAEEKKKKAIIQKDYDPFEDVINEMKAFRREFVKSKINRIIAAQKIATFREQVEVMSSKYDMGAKEQAIQLFKQIERDTEFAFGK